MPPACFLNAPTQKYPKGQLETSGFKTSCTLFCVVNLLPFAARSRRTAVIAAYDELTFVLRRCRSCGATVEPKVLFGVGMSGSGTEAETIR